MDKDSFIACLGFRSKTGIIKKYSNEVNDKYHKEKELKFENPFDKEIIENVNKVILEIILSIFHITNK